MQMISEMENLVSAASDKKREKEPSKAASLFLWNKNLVCSGLKKLLPEHDACSNFFIQQLYGILL